MHAPADRTVKRLSVEEWFARYDVIDLLKTRTGRRERALNAAPPPADRVAVRA